MSKSPELKQNIAGSIKFFTSYNTDIVFFVLNLDWSGGAKYSDSLFTEYPHYSLQVFSSFLFPVQSCEFQKLYLLSIFREMSTFSTKLSNFNIFF